MKTIFLILLLCFSSVLNSQNKSVNCKEKAEELKLTFENQLNDLKEIKVSLYDLKNNDFKEKEGLLESIKNKEIELSTLNDELLSTYNNFLSLKKLCGEENHAEINEAFGYKDHIFNQKKTVEKTTYSYYGDNLIIKDNLIDEATDEGRILKKALDKETKKSYFGDITIPKNNQILEFIDEDFEEKREECKQIQNSIKREKCEKKIKNLKAKTYKFKKVDIEIYDGVFSDVRVHVEYNNEIHTFSNYVGVNFLKFSEVAKRTKLFYMQTERSSGGNYKNRIMSNLFVRLGDILVYNYKIGSNFIPHDLSISLPLRDSKNELTNLNSSVNYEIRQSTHLDRILELRTYTDFLALFGESNNGLVQIEGKAKFYLFPNPHQIFSTKVQGTPFKSVYPYVNYSRFEKGDNFVSLLLDSSTGNYMVNNPMDLIEGSFLTMGGEIDIYQVHHKNYPVTFTLQANYNFQLTKLKMPNDTFDNVRGVSYGGALDIKTKRFNNFGFNYKFGYSLYDFENYNESIETGNFNIDLPSKIPVLLNQAEVFYHPSQDPNQAIFMRLKIFNYSGNENDNAFYQFQFGYKFSIGSRKVD